METLIENKNYLHDDEEFERYHDAKEHGITWALLHEMLHIIVLGFSLFGLVRMRVKFIHMVKLVNYISYFMIAHSFYMSFKFILMGIVMYIFNMKLDLLKLTAIDFNCSLKDPSQMLRTIFRATYRSPDSLDLNNLLTFDRDMLMMSKLLDILGGPYKLLGIKTTLMYGFYGISIYIMLALFPIELFFVKINFNFIRFVLSDPSCLNDFYEKRRRHMARLNKWSRNSTTSWITMGMKQRTNQRYLKTTNIAYDIHELLKQMDRGSLSLVLSQERPSLNSIDSDSLSAYEQSPIKEYLQAKEPINALAHHHHNQREKTLRHSLSINHFDYPSYDVGIANTNLKYFEPFVRSARWFKVSMIIYPCFIAYYFLTLTFTIGFINYYMDFSLDNLHTECELKCKSEFGQDCKSINQPEVASSFYDSLTYYETQYAIINLSVASSFYCSYFFGTIFELHVWLQELNQQLDISKLLLLFSDGSTCDSSLPPAEKLTFDQMILFHELDHLNLMDCVNDFGGLNKFISHLRFIMLSKQSLKLKIRETIAIKLFHKKQTILRATYLNFCLFIDELDDTRKMTEITLIRTTQIVCGFAVIVALSKVQYQSSYSSFTYLLLAAWMILNLYLVMAASINSGFNKLLPKIQALMSAYIISGSDHDLSEFWLKHLQTYGASVDSICYRILGHKITWSSIVQVSKSQFLFIEEASDGQY